jgi:hypothetical protein
MRGKQIALILVNLLISFVLVAQDRTDILTGCYAITYGYGGRKIEFDSKKPLFTKDLSALDKEYADGKEYGSKLWPATKPQMIYSNLIQKYFVRRL